ncbi:biotin carboxylase N-terminal domain-containing protein [Gordonia sp. N1V]|uniref:acetyl/propionyl/methylcrotonyl-CoA carboxylase subunit alpha n=1 Tax=Gordonia sp. N1V TaxID=3034163 RepID=UPI0023E23777|nr:biotin carboxylase N-terminal domain-containing protein [Gordonia sp. N1V]MDF3281121.1 biotin carboxylase N-terminal domain-containing protein [Gordonia sp. N1V]
MTTIDTVLIANRGEIAVRVIRTLHRLGKTAVAVFSDADAHAPHVQLADRAVRLGPAAARDSYLDIVKVIDAARRTGAQAIHPGYGFLSENTEFAAACESAGIAFLGPSARAIEIMGDKITAKTTVEKFGVPTVPGIARPGLSDSELISAAAEVGYPVLVKPSAGGGGKGMRLVHQPADLADALASARREAASSFGDDTLFLERFVTRPRHIEVQILADNHGKVVHLGERECSLQRRHQKVIEEAPSALLDAATRTRIGTAACDTARSVDYSGAGTVEFIVSADAPDEFFFMEMNTRLQVEHPVTELVTGLDLVEWQIRVAEGESLAVAQEDIVLTGHAVEARVYAEDPGAGFLPTGGNVLALSEPHGVGVRVDSGIVAGSSVGSDYDPMLAKVIAYGSDRATALAKLDLALAEYDLLGLQTNVDFVRHLLADDDVQAGRLDTALLDSRAEVYSPPVPGEHAWLTGGVALWLEQWSGAGTDPWNQPSGWRIASEAPFVTRWDAGDEDIEVAISGTPERATARIGDALTTVAECRWVDDAHHRLSLLVDNLRLEISVARVGRDVWVSTTEGTWLLRAAATAAATSDGDTGSTELRSPMPATVISVPVADGAVVTAGTTVVVVEAMKMEHALSSPIDGMAQVFVSPGQQVAVDQVLATIAAAETTAEGGEQ